MAAAKAAAMGVRAVVAVLFFFVAGAGSASAGSPPARLAHDVVPVAYDLTIAPDVEKSRSTATESVDVTVRRAVDAIALNADRITIARASIDGRPAQIDSLTKIEQIRLHTGAPLRPGAHRIELAFTSPIGNGGDPTGLFGGGNGPGVLTMFEPSRARRMFPCFDEPEFRARFTLHVRAPSAWAVVANMPLRERRELGDGTARNDFEPSPPIPTYAITLDAGIFAHVDGAAGSVPIRVFVRAGQEAHARVMLADAQRLVPFYERFFGVPFPLPKLDIVVGSGALQSALEGWGAITFYSEAIPFGAQFEGGEHGRREAVEALAHEIAHQWTGDLVTMRWWRDTFVAEGVATFSQREAVRTLYPELHAWLDDDRNVAYVMRATSGKKQTPVFNETIRTDLEADAAKAFDSATYEKGASAVAGWRDAVGESTFHAGLTRYLTRFAYGSATFEDFWDAVGGARGVEYGRSWLAQPGFPIVDVRSSCARGATTVELRQRPYASDPNPDRTYAAQRWIVPLRVHAGSQERAVVLHADRAVVTLPACGDVTIDPGERPYFIVRYDDATYAAFARRAESLDQRERERLERDALMLHGANLLADEPFLRLAASAREPLDADVWAALAKEEMRLDALLYGAAELRTLAQIQRRQLLPLAERYGRIAYSGRAPFRLAYDPGMSLAAAGDADVGALFRTDYRTLAGGGNGGGPNVMARWPTALLAGSAATSSDVDSAEAALRSRPQSGLIAEEWALLSCIGDDELAARVLRDVVEDRTLARDASLPLFFALGARHPHAAFAYLREHLASVKRLVPPTQQRWVIGMGVARSLWPAAPPDEMKAFLGSAFPGDFASARDAGALVDRNWAQRRALVRALRAIAQSPG